MLSSRCSRPSFAVALLALVYPAQSNEMRRRRSSSWDPDPCDDGDDSCVLANNGYCNEYNQQCPDGTDCTDCAGKDWPRDDDALALTGSELTKSLETKDGKDPCEVDPKDTCSSNSIIGNTCDEPEKEGYMYSSMCFVGTDCEDCNPKGGAYRRRHTDDCSWDDVRRDPNADDILIGILFGGTWGAVVIGIVMIIATSLPLCCGVAMDFAKIIAAIGLLAGGILPFIPLISALTACGQAVGAVCDAGPLCPSGCDTSIEGLVDALCKAAAILGAYISGMGWIAIVLGIVSQCLSCAVCCKCCGPLTRHGQHVPASANGPAPVVVSQAVRQASEKE